MGHGGVFTLSGVNTPSVGFLNLCSTSCSVSVFSSSRILLSALLQVLQASEDAACLRKFLSLHGLQLLWSWMVDTNDSDALEVLQFRQQVSQVTGHVITKGPHVIIM